MTGRTRAWAVLATTAGVWLWLAGTDPSRTVAQVPKDASAATAKANDAVLTQLPFADRADFEDATRGFIATVPELVIKTGDVTNWNLAAYDFLKDAPAPPTVNPSLWRIAQLNLNNGLFKVTDHVYQVHGFDLSNMTIIEGDRGLILIDPLVTIEASSTALALYYQHRPKKPVVAVVYTHSHADHYGGVKGVVQEADVKAGPLPNPPPFAETLTGEGTVDELGGVLRHEAGVDAIGEEVGVPQQPLQEWDIGAYALDRGRARRR